MVIVRIVAPQVVDGMIQVPHQCGFTPTYSVLSIIYQGTLSCIIASVLVGVPRLAGRAKLVKSGLLHQNDNLVILNVHKLLH